MNDLLLSQDPDVLEAVLRLIFRRAQQIASNGQLNSGATFNLTHDRVKDLTQGWKPVRQAGITMYDVVKDELEKEIPAELQEVSFEFYRNAASPTSTAPNSFVENVEEQKEASSVTTPAIKSTKIGKNPATGSATPIAASSTKSMDMPEAEGLTSFHLGNVADSGKSAHDILADAMETYHVPTEEKLHLLQRIRVAMSLKNKEMRRLMLRLRLLAISVLGKYL